MTPVSGSGSNPLDGPIRTHPPPEGRLRAGVMRELRARGAWVIVATGTVTAGAPDIVGCFMGVPIAWETKTLTGRPRKNQLHHLEQARRNGASAHIVRSVAHARALLDEIDAAHTNHE